MKTYSPTPADIEHKWHVVDADGMVLGRLASKVAQLLRGKHKPIWAPHMDVGDYVVVINAAKVRVTGKKREQKQYFRYSGYMGNEKFIPLSVELEKHPDRVIERAVFGMLPKNTLGRQVIRRKLRVYAGPEHPHAGQQPAPIKL